MFILVSLTISQSSASDPDLPKNLSSARDPALPCLHCRCLLWKWFLAFPVSHLMIFSHPIYLLISTTRVKNKVIIIVLANIQSSFLVLALGQFFNSLLLCKEHPMIWTQISLSASLLGNPVQFIDIYNHRAAMLCCSFSMPFFLNHLLQCLSFSLINPRVYLGLILSLVHMTSISVCNFLFCVFWVKYVLVPVLNASPMTSAYNEVSVGLENIQ